MKNIHSKIKRFLAMLLITVSLVNTTVMSYSTAVNATSGVITMGILDALYAMFGVSIGIGGQQTFFSQADLDYIITAAKNGNVVQMGDYGEVDFGDAAAVQQWLDACAAVDGFLIGTASNNLAFGENVAKQIRSNMLAIDMASYKNTGTCASSALNEYLTNFRVDTGDGLLDLQEACDLFSGDNDNNNDIDWTKFAAISALISGALISKATDFKDYFASLTKSDASEFTEYDEAFKDAVIFDGTYQTDADGNYVYKMSCPYYIGDASKKILYKIDCSSSYKIVGYKTGGNINFYALSSLGTLINVNLPVDGYGNVSSIFSDGFVGNIPLYSTREACIAALQADDFSDAENIQDNPYVGFKDNIGTATSALDTPMRKFFARHLTADDFIDKVNSAVDVCTDKGGTADAIPAVADVLGDGAADTDSDTDSSVVTKDYTGILGKIYNMLSSILKAILALPAAIMELPETIWSFFQNPIAAIQAAIDAIVSVLDPILEGVLAIPIAIMELPDLVWECFKDPIGSIDTVISSIPDTLQAILAAILALPDTIMALPDLIWDCFSDTLADADTMSGTLMDILDGVLILTNPVVGIWDLVKAIPGLLEDIRDGVYALDDDYGGSGGSGDENDDSNVRYSFINGIFVIIYILIQLLFIFIHLFEFVVNIFKIPADPGFITGDFAIGFNYIKTIELEGMEISVYDFLMALIHILVIFSVVKILKEYISDVQI